MFQLLPIAQSVIAPPNWLLACARPVSRTCKISMARFSGGRMNIARSYTKARAGGQASRVNDFGLFAEPGVEEPGGVSQRKARRHPRDTVDHAQSDRNHGRGERNAGEFWPTRRDEVDGEEGKSDESDADD